MQNRPQRSRGPWALSIPLRTLYYQELAFPSLLDLITHIVTLCVAWIIGDQWLTS